MIQPPELASEAPFGPWSSRGCDVWDAICAAEAGDAEALRRLLARDPNLYRSGYWYTTPIHFAVREGHEEAVRVLLEAGADPAAVELGSDSLITIARDRGHEAVARLLEEASARQERTAPDLARADHPIHLAAAAGDADLVEKLLDAEPALVHRGDGRGGTPLGPTPRATHRSTTSPSTWRSGVAVPTARPRGCCSPAAPTATP
jgi:ankyrin repeat protein